jgi:glycosyltransferase involved in cell wall biosynthesis
VCVEPTHPDALAAALGRAHTDDALRAPRVARGHERVARFPWARAIDGFVDLYRRVAASRS